MWTGATATPKARQVRLNTTSQTFPSPLADDAAAQKGTRKIDTDNGYNLKMRHRDATLALRAHIDKTRHNLVSFFATYKFTQIFGINCEHSNLWPLCKMDVKLAGSALHWKFIEDKSKTKQEDAPQWYLNSSTGIVPLPNITKWRKLSYKIYWSHSEYSCVCTYSHVRFRAVYTHCPLKDKTRAPISMATPLRKSGSSKINITQGCSSSTLGREKCIRKPMITPNEKDGDYENEECSTSRRNSSLVIILSKVIVSRGKGRGREGRMLHCWCAQLSQIIRAVQTMPNT